jgi:hypothetical protein
VQEAWRSARDEQRRKQSDLMGGESRCGKKRQIMLRSLEGCADREMDWLFGGFGLVTKPFPLLQ